MRFKIGFGINKEYDVQHLNLLGASWEWYSESERWIEIHLLGFILFFDFGQ
jgi:hypothetical protein